MSDSSAIYRAIVTSKFRTEKMHNFYQTVGDGENKNTIYLTFGRSTPWAENETEVGFAPPYPSDNSDGVVDMWTNMLGAVKIQLSMLDAVTPRKDWGDTDYSNPKNFKIGEIVVSNTAPYNRTDISKGWMVYRCVNVPNQGTCSIDSLTDMDECIKLGGTWTSSVESAYAPAGTADTIDMGDGYEWEYLYEIPADVSINRCTNEYIVVPWPDDVEADPSRWGYENNLTWQPNDYNVIFKVKANTIRFRGYLDSIYFPQASLPGNTGFRQLSLVVNPLEAKATSNAENVKATKDNYVASQLDPQSGEMIYMENRQPIIRATDSTEEINLIFEF